jgi:predicted TIM-barrel fold metal-dependent hydrolase
MPNAKRAARELRRSVKELRFVGAILNDFKTVSHDGKDDAFKLHYQSECDDFWSTVQELRIPVYIHTRILTIEKLCTQTGKVLLIIHEVFPLVSVYILFV